MTRLSASIVVLTYNNLEYTRQCVNSIHEHTQSGTYELILVDNASNDGTQDYLRDLAENHPNIQILINEKNEGFARGNNLGATLTRGDAIVFLNNDTVVTEGWLPGLLSKLEDPTVGMVGPVTNSSGNETRIKVEYTDIDGMAEFAKKHCSETRGKVFEISMLAFLCVALRRAVYNEVGPLDERFGIGMFEDDDYALRLKARGYKILCAEDVFVHHWGSASFSKMDATDFWTLFKHNLTQFEEKWGQQWLPHPLRAEYIPEQLRQYVDGLMGMAALAGLVAERDKFIVDLEDQLVEKDQAIIIRDEYINNIANSDGWKLIQLSGRIKNRLFPPGTIRSRIITFLFRPLRAWLRMGSIGVIKAVLQRIWQTPPGRFLSKVINKLIPWPIRNFYNAWREEYKLYDHTKVILYANDSILPEYKTRHILANNADITPVKVSLVSTALNEGVNAEAWLESLLSQTRYPDELVITDGGSTDQTVEILRNTSVKLPFPVTIIEAPGANISHGRNIAIQKASYPIIACSDFGCVLDEDWLKNLILPFEIDEQSEVSAGYYKADPSDNFGRITGSYFVLDINQVNPQIFLPSSRSIAFRKSVWEKAGGYPEHLTDAGEDTLFDYHAKVVSRNWAFVPEAMVFWRAPDNFRKLYKTFFRYARGDGETGTNAHLYWNQLKSLTWRFIGLLLVLLLLGLIGLLIYQWYSLNGVLIFLGLIVVLVLLRTLSRIRVAMKKWRINSLLAAKSLLIPPVIQMAMQRGFAVGVKNRPKIRQHEIDRYTLQLKLIVDDHPRREGIIVYPPTVDWGFMFQRPQQMARAFAGKGYLYFFCTKNERIDDVIGFRKVEGNLFICHVPLETFKSIDDLILYAGTPWVNRMLANFNHPRLIYDHFDEIVIFSAHPEDHQDLIQKADVVLVTAQRLRENVIGQRPDVLFVPNGVDYDYVQGYKPSPHSMIPHDLLPIEQKGKPIIGYTGALAEWFDYDLLRYLAKNRQDLEFVLIGTNYDGSLDKSGILRSGLKNIHWLGMKPYHELFQYQWHYDVGIIPFLINHLTLSTTPVKMFEYMACGLPVISTDMPEARNYPGVFIAETHERFLDLLDTALTSKSNPQYLAMIDKVAQEHTWKSRVDTILTHLYSSPHQHELSMQTDP